MAFIGGLIVDGLIEGITALAEYGATEGVAVAAEEGTEIAAEEGAEVVAEQAAKKGLSEETKKILKDGAGTLATTIGSKIYDEMKKNNDTKKNIPIPLTKIAPSSGVPMKQIKEIGDTKIYESDNKTQDWYQIQASSDEFKNGPMKRYPDNPILIINEKDKIPYQENPNPAFGQIVFNSAGNKNLKRVMTPNKMIPEQAPWGTTTWPALNTYH